MGTEKKCSFYRKSDNSNLGHGIGYCDLGVVWAICDGDMKLCEEPSALIKNIYVEWNRSKASTMRENVHSDGSL